MTYTILHSGCVLMPSRIRVDLSQKDTRQVPEIWFKCTHHRMEDIKMRWATVRAIEIDDVCFILWMMQFGWHRKWRKEDREITSAVNMQDSLGTYFNEKYMENTAQNGKLNRKKQYQNSVSQWEVWIPFPAVCIWFLMGIWLQVTVEQVAPSLKLPWILMRTTLSVVSAGSLFCVYFRNRKHLVSTEQLGEK